MKKVLQTLLFACFSLSSSKLVAAPFINFNENVKIIYTQEMQGGELVTVGEAAVVKTDKLSGVTTVRILTVKKIPMGITCDEMEIQKTIVATPLSRGPRKSSTFSVVTTMKTIMRPWKGEPSVTESVESKASVPEKDLNLPLPTNIKKGDFDFREPIVIGSA